MKAFFTFLRTQVHPLHHLRKSRFFRERLIPLLDRDVAVKGDFVRKVYVKAITHCSFYMADGGETRIKSLFLDLLNMVPPGSVFFDVGANIGFYTWLAAGVQNNLKIICFEPDPENFRLLTKTAQAWRSPNVNLRQMGVSDTCGSADFQRDTITSATGSLEQTNEWSVTKAHFNVTGTSIRVAISTIDAESAKEGMPAIIKIDVEGHEAKVFAGAWNVIQKVGPVILFESFMSNPNFLSKLNDFGYILFDADNGGLSTARTSNYVAVRSGSLLEAVVREHLSN